MKYLYVDEKGPQNVYRKSTPFNKANKLKQADDNMHVYAANAIIIDSSEIVAFENSYKELETTYLKNKASIYG